MCSALHWLTAHIYSPSKSIHPRGNTDQKRRSTPMTENHGRRDTEEIIDCQEESLDGCIPVDKEDGRRENLPGGDKVVIQYSQS